MHCANKTTIKLSCNVSKQDNEFLGLIILNVLLTPGLQYLKYRYLFIPTTWGCLGFQQCDEVQSLEKCVAIR